MKTELYLGLDVHKEVDPDGGCRRRSQSEVRDNGGISNDLHTLEKYMRKAHGRN